MLRSLPEPAYGFQHLSLGRISVELPWTSLEKWQGKPGGPEMSLYFLWWADKWPAFMISGILVSMWVDILWVSRRHLGQVSISKPTCTCKSFLLRVSSPVWMEKLVAWRFLPKQSMVLGSELTDANLALSWATGPDLQLWKSLLFPWTSLVRLSAPEDLLFLMSLLYKNHTASFQKGKIHTPVKPLTFAENTVVTSITSCSEVASLSV